MILPVQNAAGQDQEASRSSLQAYRQVLNLDLSGARKTLAKADRDALAIYASHLSVFLALTLREDPEAYDVYTDKRKELIDETKDILGKEDPYYRFVIAEIYFQSSIIKAKYGAYVGAAFDFRRSYFLIHENRELFPDFIPNYKTFGAINSLISAIPGQYQWILPFVGMSAPEDDDLGLLGRVHDKSPFWFEANALSALINIYLRQEPSKAVGLLTSLKEAWSESSLFKFLYAVALMKDRQSEEALLSLNQLQEAPLTIDYVDYLQGEILLHKGAYDQAIRHYGYFAGNYQGKNYLKDAVYKQALCYYLKGDADAARRYFDLARQAPASKSDADQHAQRQLEKGDLPNALILRLRFYTDGGYFIKADSLIKAYHGVRFTDIYDQAEWVYRQARLFHLQGRENEAIPLYEKVIDDYPDVASFYIKPNSALQLGYIYQKRGDSKTAAAYFTRAMDYKGHAYKNGIDSKAKAALEGMK